MVKQNGLKNGEQFILNIFFVRYNDYVITEGTFHMTCKQQSKNKLTFYASDALVNPSSVPKMLLMMRSRWHERVIDGTAIARPALDDEPICV